MKIRSATPNDIKSVAEIYNDIHTLEEAGSLSIGWIRDVYPTAETARQALQKGELFVEEPVRDMEEILWIFTSSMLWNIIVIILGWIQMQKIVRQGLCIRNWAIMKLGLCLVCLME